MSDEVTAQSALETVKQRCSPDHGEIVEQTFLEEVTTWPIVAGPEQIAKRPDTAAMTLLSGPPDRPALTVRTVVEVTVTAELRPEVVKVHSINVPRGEVRVVTEGTTGEVELVERRTWLNRQLVDVEIVERTVREAPTPRRVIVGRRDDG
ncbi:MAG: hypothetical protein GF393_00785 [Armatimonadia bacterium]|nr:hypothetical protein [Armatimonadia bacterium]